MNKTTEQLETYISEGNPNTKERISDEQLVTEICNALDKEDTVPGKDKRIDITAKEGVVTLCGTVSSEQVKMTIGDKAAAFAGFGQVVNSIEVKE